MSDTPPPGRFSTAGLRPSTNIEDRRVDYQFPRWAYYQRGVPPDDMLGTINDPQMPRQEYADGYADGGDTGVAPGFGGFAVTPDGQAQYWNRKHNPYRFLQDPIDLTPESDSYARGGLAGVTPQMMQQWAKFMHYHSPAQYRRGGLVRLSDGGDATEGGQASTNGGPGDSATGQTGGGGYGSSEGPGAMSGPPGAENVSQASGYGAVGPGGLAGFSANDEGMVGHSTPGAQPGFGTEMTAPDGAPRGPQNPEEPGLEQLGMAGLLGLGKGALGLTGVPGLGALGGLAAKAAGLDSGLSGGAKMGANIGSGFGAALGAIGGPAGMAIGSGLGAMGGAMLGAHGEQGFGTVSGSSDASAASGAHGTSSGAPGSDQEDLLGLIRRIKATLTSSNAYASGGSVAGGGGGNNHAFHRGSGLFQGSSDGRADAIHMALPRGGYVVPADVVSGLGQGNTQAGARKLKAILPPQPHPAGFAAGGAVQARVSAGEYYIHPAHVAALGNGDLRAGSDKLDTMVGHVRRNSARQVAQQPPPR